MTKSILSLRQKHFLSLFANKPTLNRSFYLTGGTALTEFYIPYRYSEDLDFFSENEIDLSAVTTFLKSVKKDLTYNQMDINTSYNRNIIHLIFDNETLKLEFTYFPFPQINRPKKHNGINVDSLLDIAVNKLFTIYQKPRSRDFIDLYIITQLKKFSFTELIKKAKLKFDWHIDPIKLGTQFLLVDQLKDYPNLIEDIDENRWQNFFKSEAKKLSVDIFK